MRGEMIMSNEEYVKQAIEQFHRENPGLPKPGDVIAHESDPRAYEVREIEEGVVTGFYVEGGQEYVARFPVDEVFNPGTVMEIAKQLKVDRQLKELSDSSGYIMVDGGLYEL
jgi:hypothetical protein